MLLGLYATKIFVLFCVVYQHDIRPFTGRGDLQQGPERWFGPDGDYALPLDSVHVDGIQHGQQYTPSFTVIGLLPKARQVLQELSGSDRGISVGHDQQPQFFFLLFLLTAIFLFGEVAVDVDLGQPPEPLLGLLPVLANPGLAKPAPHRNQLL